MDATPFWVATGLFAAVGVAVLFLMGWRGARGRRRAVDEKQAYLRGVQYLLVDDTDAAIEALTRVVEVNTETIETYFALGALFRRKGELERAIRIHQNIILRPGLPAVTRAEARYELAQDYRAAGMLRQAKEAFAKVADEAPKGWTRLAEALGQLRDLHTEALEPEEAVEAQRRRMKVISEDERSILAHCLASLARARMGAGENDGARSALKEALKADPRCVDAHLAAADLAIATTDAKLAKKHFDRALDSMPEAVSLAYPRLADLYYQSGTYEKLGDYLRKWVSDRPDVPQLRLALARHLRTRGLTERAVEELRIALDLDPRFHDARQELGRILLEESMNQALREQFEQVLATIGSEPAFVCTSCHHRLSELAWRCPRCAAWDSIGPRDPRDVSPAA